MRSFQIKSDFMLDGEPVKIMSGAIHYFRIQPSQWEDSLYNLKALGANTVETYVPWNLHEPSEGQFDFQGIKDIRAFIKIAERLGLMVILRPSVYICAEWDFGGLPAWLLKTPGVRLRSTDPLFMSKVANYFKVLLPYLAPLQITNGGPVIMMQIENEYGSYGMDKDYLRQNKALMRQYGIDVPLFTSDGAWPAALDAGSLIEEDVFVTGNFGGQASANAKALRTFTQQHGKNWPIMCMEYWDGWFNLWGESIIKRDPEDLAEEVKAMLEVGSINLYMFHGGTNFGFYNGCAANDTGTIPQITSYDYDALLTEAGAPTAKYYAVQKAIKSACPGVWQAEPRQPQIANLGTFEIVDSVSLFETLDRMSAPQSTTYPLTMEEAGSGYGYMLYTTTLTNYGPDTKLKLVEVGDRAQVYVNGVYRITQDQNTLGQEVSLNAELSQSPIQVACLIENQGRVNYGFRFDHPSQRKGLRGGLMHDIHFHQGYTQYALDFSKSQLAGIDFTAGQNSAQPSFYRFSIELERPVATFIDCSSYGKGVVFVNGENLGRYWQKGPVYSLYCPKDLLKSGTNEIIVFETEGIEVTRLSFTDQPVVDKS